MTPSLTVKLMQLGMELVCGLQALCQVGKTLFFPLFFLYHWKGSIYTHMSVVTEHPSTVSGTSFVAVTSCQETISCWFSALPFALDWPNIRDFSPKFEEQMLMIWG